MNESSTPAGEVSESTRNPLDDVKIPVDFVIGTQSLALDDLRSLKEGHVFDLSEDSSAVGIVVNGRRHGEGRLVKIGDHLGVVVERLGG